MKQLILFCVCMFGIIFSTSAYSHTTHRQSKHKSHIAHHKPKRITHRIVPKQSSQTSFKTVGNASWYGKRWNAKRTASGQLFNSHKLTAAHRSLPLGTKVLVKNMSTGKAVVVTINDRGPYVKNRIIDLSEAAAKQLHMKKTGVSKVEIRPIEVASYPST